VNRPARWVTYASMVLAGLAAALGLVVVVYGAYLATFLELPKSDEHPPLRLYSGPFLLQPDLSIARSHLLERLQRLGYRRVTVPVQSSGDYQLTEEALTLYLHPQPEAHVGATMVTLSLDQGRVTDVRFKGNEIVQTFGGEAEGKGLQQQSGNYMAYRGAQLRFGKLTMSDTDMVLIDMDPQDPFDFYLDHYKEQLVAGYTKTTPEFGLRVYMRDFDKLQNRKRSKQK